MANSNNIDILIAQYQYLERSKLFKTTTNEADVNGSAALDFSRFVISLASSKGNVPLHTSHCERSV
jgi:hypothetical protein